LTKFTFVDLEIELLLCPRGLDKVVEELVAVLLVHHLVPDVLLEVDER
jgi:hypothetical protein